MTKKMKYSLKFWEELTALYFLRSLTIRLDPRAHLADLHTRRICAIILPELLSSGLHKIHTKKGWSVSLVSCLLNFINILKFVRNIQIGLSLGVIGVICEGPQIIISKNHSLTYWLMG